MIYWLNICNTAPNHKGLVYLTKAEAEAAADKEIFDERVIQVETSYSLSPITLVTGFFGILIILIGFGLAYEAGQHAQWVADSVYWKGP